VEELRREGIIEESNYPWYSSLLVAAAVTRYYRNFGPVESSKIIFMH
jgi:hypothetical protein